MSWLRKLNILSEEENMKFIKCIKSSAFQTSGNWYELLSDINTKQLEIKAIWGGRIYIVNSIRFDLTDIRNEITVPKQEEYKMKKFQNEQHKQLHNALIGAGFVECNGKNMPNVKDSWNYSYINKQLDEYIYFNICEDDDVYIRHISNNEPTAFYGTPIDDIIAHYEALAPSQPITKDNILDVLKHNGYNESTLEAYCELCIRNSTAYYGAVMLNNVPNWIGAVEAIVCFEILSFYTPW